MRRLLSLLALLPLAACDCGGGRLNTAEGELALAPDLSFGTVGVGEVRTLVATLRNVGNGPVNLEAFEVAAPFSACLERQSGACVESATLIAGEEASVRVGYAPTEPNAGATENHEDELVVLSDSSTKPEISIRLSGHAIPARLVVTPASLDFGPVEVGDAKTLPLTVENKGLDPIKLSAPAIGSLVFGADLWNLDRTLAAGGKIVLPVTYSPQTGGNDSGALTFATDVSNRAQVQVPLAGVGEQSKISLCYGFAGEALKCLPDAQGKLAGELDFGALPEGTSRAATLILKNEGNVQAKLFGLADGKGAQMVDQTAAANPCAVSPAAGADFVFTPASFGAKLPEDAGDAGTLPPKERTVEVTYAPHHACPPQGSNPGDLADRALVSLKAGDRAGSPTFFIDLKGYSKVGLVRPDNLYWDVKNAVALDYRVHNTGPGPLHVSGVEFVEADSVECAIGCAQRTPCAASALPECALFSWDSGPAVVDIPGATSGETEAVVGKIRYSPGAFCGTGASDAGVCFPTGTVRICARVSSDDPFHPHVCGELKGRTF